MKIYDAFLFYNEIELLELRLRILDPYVDHFVISECDYTFSGKKKGFNFEANIKKFSRFLDKIVYIKNSNSDVTNSIQLVASESNSVRRGALTDIVEVYDTMRHNWGCMPHWSRDFLHREFVRFGLTDCHSDDLIIFGDLDEIPSENALLKARSGGPDQIFCCEQDMYYYTMNLKVDEPWRGTRITRWKNINRKSLNALRTDFHNQIIIENGGWHFSFFGGEEKIRAKIQDYGHQEFNTVGVHTELRRRVLHARDVLGRDIKLNWVPISTRHPTVVFERMNDYLHFQSGKPRISSLNAIGYLFFDFLRKVRKAFMHKRS